MRWKNSTSEPEKLCENESMMMPCSELHESEVTEQYTERLHKLPPKVKTEDQPSSENCCEASVIPMLDRSNLLLNSYQSLPATSVSV